MTLDALMKTPLMERACLVAGEEGMHDEVVGCLLANDLNKQKGSLTGLLIIFTEVARLETFLLEVPCMLPAGILILNAQLTQLVRTEIQKRCQALRLPLIIMDQRGGRLRFVQRLSALLVKSFGVSQNAELWLQAVCEGQTAEYIETDGAPFGYHAENDYLPLYLKITDAEDHIWMHNEKALDLACELFSSELSDTEYPVLHFQSDADAVMFIALEKREDLKPLYKRIAQVMREVQKFTPGLHWTAVTGPHAHTLNDFHSCMNDAIKLEGALRAFRVSESVSTFEEWYPFMLLLNQPEHKLREYVDWMLGPILENKDLIDTLIAYLTYSENLKRSAEELHIHVNTMKYRLEQIQRLLNLDLSDHSVRFRLRSVLAIMIYVNKYEY